MFIASWLGAWAAVTRGQALSGDQRSSLGALGIVAGCISLLSTAHYTARCLGTRINWERLGTFGLPVVALGTLMRFIWKRDVFYLVFGVLFGIWAFFDLRDFLRGWHRKILSRKWPEGWPREALDDLLHRYSEPHRHYHTLDHIEHCLEEFSAVVDQAKDPAALQWAIWYHDAVYDTRAHDNEDKGAALAEETAAKAGLPFGAKAAGMIRATRRHEPSPDPDTQLLLDIDLAILGQHSRAFRRYERNIRREYAWVDDATFLAKRVEILKSFLARPQIYGTPSLREEYEESARRNLSESLEGLDSR